MSDGSEILPEEPQWSLQIAPFMLPPIHQTPLSVSSRTI
jgi:hypothetical protein